MVEFHPHRGNVKALLKSPQVAAMLTQKAHPMARRIQGDTPKSKRAGGGGTARSTKVEAPDKSASGDRVRVRITQRSYSGRRRPRGGAAAPLQFGNKITEQRSHMTRSLRRSA